ncbi:DMT family transporter [Limibacillus halophilus]|uniref:Drug/metabolite transporter (DMT)-like permease n=1 Tax=Limibacillus halophilus TaxID=1579333 RepID=A0A839SY75_9PROT|nr:DMT family transporter [Limibacillus halophilus]MBB3065975.1 drug/metabolite transporter (DMT)-like permease [Limibacillus halophilus]
MTAGKHPTGDGRQASSWMAPGALLFAALLWGTSWLPIRWIAEYDLAPGWVNILLYGAAAVFMLPAFWLRPLPFTWEARLAWASAFFFGAALMLWGAAILTGEVVRVILLFYLSPVWASILGRLFLKDRVGPLRILAIFCGLLGAAVVLGLQDGLPLPQQTGDWFGLFAGIAFALAALFSRMTPGIGGPSQSGVAYVVATLLALFLLLDPELGATPTGRQITAAMGVAAISAVIWFIPAAIVVFWATKKLEPGRAMLLMMTEVIFATVSAAILTDEPFGFRELIGCVLVATAGGIDAFSQLRRGAVR